MLQLVGARGTRECELTTLKPGTTSTFVIFINRACISTYQAEAVAATFSNDDD